MSNCWSIKLLETKNFEVLKCSVEIIFIGSKFFEDQHFFNGQTSKEGTNLMNKKKSTFLGGQHF